MGKRTCSLPECEDPHFCKGFCGPHYRRWKRHGDPLVQRPRPSEQVCDVPECGKPRACREWCKPHYNNWARHGTPVRPRPPRPVTSRGDGENKTCTQCGVIKPLSEFSPTSRKSPMATISLRGECKQCIRENAAAKYKADPEAARKRSADWYYRNIDKMPEKRRRYTLMANYGLTLEDFAAMFAAQGERCAACGGDKPRGQNWAVDHCHTSGAVRAILCNPCNTALGLLRDDADVIMRLALYRLRFADLLSTSQVHEEQGKAGE